MAVEATLLGCDLGCAACRGWVSVPAQGLLSGELEQCARGRWSGTAGRSLLLVRVP